MARLVYSAITSLDGYTADQHDDIQWGAPDQEVFEFIFTRERPVGTYLYGRRMYETMVFWETVETAEGDASPDHVFADMWRGADKIVYSRTLDAPTSARTRVERSFDAREVGRLKRSAAHDLTIGGAHLAGQAIAAGLVDEVNLYVTPITVGGGTPALFSPSRHDFALVEVNRFEGGVVHLGYRVVR